MIAGANRDDYHLRHVTPGEDFTAEFHDLRQVAAGDACIELRRAARARQDDRDRPHLQARLQVFGVHGAARAATPMATEVTLIMGSYGIGIERILSAAVEQRHDKDGMALPVVDRAVRGGGDAGEQRRRRRSGAPPKRSIRRAWRWASMRCWTIATSAPA